MKVLILAAGYATRLYPRTKNFPKPLLEVNKKPIIGYLVEKLASLEDVSKVVVVTNGRFYRNFLRWKAGLKTKLKISIVNDKTTGPEERLGAVADMKLVFDKVGYNDDFLVLGGDNFFEGSLNGFVKAGKENSPRPTIGVVDIKDKSQAKHFGVVTLYKDGSLSGFEEKPTRPKSTLISMCLYYFPKKNLSFIKKYMGSAENFKDTLGSYIKWLSSNCGVYGFIFEDFWIDIGNISTYKKLQKRTKGRD